MFLWAGGDVQLMYPAISTNYTDPRHFQGPCKGRVEEGCRMVSEKNLTALKSETRFSVLLDLDDEMRYRLIQARGCDEVALDREMFRESGRNSLYDAQSIECNGLFDFYLYKDILHGVDKEGEPCTIKIDMLYMKAKFPACEPLIAVHQVAKTNPKCVEPLLNVLSHMNMVMRDDMSIGLTMDSAFGTAELRATKLCCEANLPLAVMLFCELEECCGVHFGGFRLDATSEYERGLWRTYIEGVHEARAVHYKKVCDRVNIDLERQGIKKAGIPSEFTLDFYYGIHYRKATRAWMDVIHNGAMEALPVEERVDFSHNFYRWLDRQLQDSEYYYFADGRAWARNTGIWTRVKADAFQAFSTKHYAQPSVLLQPIQTMPLIKLFLLSRSEPEDPFRVAWDLKAFLCDRAYMQEHYYKLNSAIMMVVDEMREIANNSLLTSISETDVRLEGLMYLYGQGESHLTRTLANADVSADISTILNLKYQSVVSAIKNALTTMSVGELKHWAMAARSVFDIRHHGKQSGAMWNTDHRGFLIETKQFGNLQMSESCHHSIFSSVYRKKLNFDLSWQNENFIELLTNSQFANFALLDKQWGMVIKIADMGSTCTVLKKSNGKLHAVYVNTKIMGSGGDSAVDLCCEQNNAFGKFLTRQKGLRMFYNSPEALDVLNSKMSALSMALMRGSGLMVAGDNSIDLEQTTHQVEAGTCLYRMEHNKCQTHSADAKSFLADLETQISDSGKGAGTTTVGWQSTKGMVSRCIRRMFSAPALVIAGNRQDTHMPESTFGGGRMQSFASNVLDGPQGVLKVQLGNVYTAVAQGTDSVSSQWTNFDFLESTKRKPLKNVTAQLSEQNYIFFLHRHIVRKILPFLQRTLSIGWKRSQYEMFCGLAHMNLSVSSVTKNMRRYYVEGETEFMRNLDGPWHTVNCFGTYAKQVVLACLGRCIRKVQARTLVNSQGVSKEVESVDFQAALQDIIANFLFVPTPMSTKLDSLYLFMHTNVLDIGQMVLFSYMLHTTNAGQHFCSLYTIAKVFREYDLTDEEDESYCSLCRYLEPLICPRKNSGRPPAGRSHAVNVLVSHLVMPSLQDLEEWFDVKQDSNFQKIHAKQESRNRMKALSVYMKSGSSLLTREKPDWLKPNRDGTRCEHKTNSSTHMIAQAFADQQKKTVVEATHTKNPLDLFHVFWNTAREGTRLPRPSKTDDEGQIDYEVPEETGHFFMKAMELTGDMASVFKHYLTLFKLSDRISTHDFFHRLMQRYWAKNLPGEYGKAIHSFGDWKNSVLDGDVLQFACNPRVDIAKKQINGVESALCIKIFASVIIQGLLARDWKKNGTVVHLRNMGQIAQELLSMMMHIRLEKACIPSNSGYLLLSTKSPHLGCDGSARLWYDDRLHVDSYLEQRNMLCVAARRERFWVKYKAEGEFRAQLIHTNVLDSMPQKPLRHCGLFPFPPESTYHMQAHFEHVRVAYERIASNAITNRSSDANPFPVAFHTVFCGAWQESVRYIPVNMTQCMIEQEICCVSGQEAWCFILHYDNVQHTFTVHTVAHIDQSKFMPLPIGKKNCFEAHLLGDFMSHGLTVQQSQPADGEARVIVEVGFKHDTKTETRSSFFFPSLHWHHLVKLSVGHTMINSTGGLVNASVQPDPVKFEHLYVNMRNEFMDAIKQPTTTWLEYNEDIKIPRGMSLWHENRESVDGTEYEMFWLVDEEKGLYLHAKDAMHLRYIISERIYECPQWIERDFAVRGNCGVLAPILLEGGERVAYSYEFDNFLRDNLFNSLHDERKKLQSNEAWFRENNGQSSIPTSTGLTSCPLRMQKELADTQTVIASRKAAIEGYLKQLRALKNTPSVVFRYILEDKTWSLPSVANSDSDVFIGVTVPHTDTDKFVKDGLYKIKFWEDMERHFFMDFVSTSQCIVTEGTEIFARWTPEIEAEMTTLGLTPVEVRQIDQNKSQDVFRGWYVLGGDATSVCMALDISVRAGQTVDQIALVKFRMFARSELMLFLTDDSCKSVVETFCFKPTFANGMNNQSIWLY